MTEGGMRAMQNTSARTRPDAVHPIYWVSADVAVIKVAPLEGQLDYYRQMFDSAELGTWMTCLPYSSRPGRMSTSPRG